VSHTSCILYFFLASRRHLSINPRYPNIDPRPKLAKALSRIVIVLNPYCCQRDNSPIREKTRRPKIRNERERAVVKHLVEREIKCHWNCSRLSKDIRGLADSSVFDIKGSSASSYDGGRWGSEGDDGIFEEEGQSEVFKSVRVQESGRRGPEDF